MSTLSRSYRKKRGGKSAMSMKKRGGKRAMSMRKRGGNPSSMSIIEIGFSPFYESYRLGPYAQHLHDQISE